MRQIWAIAVNTIKALIRKKDFYVFFIMLLVILVFLLSQSFFGMQDISRFLKDIGFSIIWIFSLIVAVTFSARQIPEEMSEKTILALLAKPVSRAHLLTGRFLGSLMASGAAFTLFYAVYIYAAVFRGEGVSLPLIIQTYVQGICFLSMACSIAICLSSFVTLSAAITLSFILYFAVMWFSYYLRSMVLSARGFSLALVTALYYMMPHYEFYDMRVRLVHAWGPIPTAILGMIAAYSAVYTAIILCIAYAKMKNEAY